MKKKLAILLAAAVLFLAGLMYTNLKGAPEVPYPPVRVTKLLQSDVIIREGLRGFSMDLDIVGDQIVLVDAMADTFVAVFDLEGNPIRRYLTKGGGPREVKKTSTLQIRNDTVFLHDQGRSRIVKFKLGVDFSETEITEDPLLGVLPYDVTPYRDGYLLSEGVEGLFSRWHSSGVDTVGDMTPLLRKVKKGARYGNRFLRILTVHPTEDLVAVAFLGTGELVIANTEGELLNVVRPLKFDFDKGPVDMPEVLTYHALTATDTALYALFIGRRTEEAFIGRSVDARHVHMYDWNGNLLRIFELAHPALDVAIHDGYFYTVGFEPIPEVRRYPIPAPSICLPDSARDIIPEDDFSNFIEETEAE